MSKIKAGVVIVLMGLALLTVPAPATAVINTGATPLQLAQAMFSNPALVTGASFDTVPPAGTPTAVADAASALAGFPTGGTTYSILTSGNADFADDPNSSGSTSANNGGGNIRGDTDYDVVILRIEFTVPQGNCLTVGDFKFLSEEFPEFVGSPFNDAFIAELDASTWTTSMSNINAPNNFAFDPMGNPISVNAAGSTSMTSSDAAGTTYDGATPILQASTPITPGAHTLFFSIFDQSDQIYDSAVFLDNIQITTVPPDECEEGAKPSEPQQASCEAYSVLVKEDDETGNIIFPGVLGDQEAHLSHSQAATAAEAGGPLPPPPGMAATSWDLTPPPAPDAHAHAHQAEYQFSYPIGPLTIRAETVYSRCDVAAHNTPAGALESEAYGHAGVEGISISFGPGPTFLLGATALEFKADAYGRPGGTIGFDACHLAEFHTGPPPPADVDVCPAANTAFVIPLPPPLLGSVSVTLNEQFAPFFDGGTGEWVYRGSAVHIEVDIPNVTDTDIWIGLVRVGVTGPAPPALVSVPPGPCSIACI